MARVAFIQDVMVEYIGYMYMSAVLKEAGHTVEIFVGTIAEIDKLTRQLKDFNPDVVGFSVLSPSEKFALTLGERVKKETNAVTTYGNIHIIMNKDKIINEPAVDFICIGEGEYPMLELCNRIDHKMPLDNIPGFWVKTKTGIVKNDLPEKMHNLDNLPFHDRLLYDKYAFFRHSKYLRIGMGRGCPYSCSFCSNPSLGDHYGGFSSYLRKQSPERAVAELEETINQRKKVNFILITDEVLWVKNEWLREFLTLYKERIKVPFSANFRFGPIKEEDIKLMAEAGAQNMVVAIESGDEHQRNVMMNKPVKNSHILQVAEWMHKHKIRFVSSVMFGLPGDTVADHVERLKFYRKANPTYVWSTFFQPYAGLKLTEQIMGQPFLPQNKEFQATLHHDMYLDLPDRDRLIRLKHVYFLCIRFPWATKFLVWLTKFRIPGLFNLLFLSHFSFYALTFERMSFIQFCAHIRTFGMIPLQQQIFTFLKRLTGQEKIIPDNVDDEFIEGRLKNLNEKHSSRMEANVTN